jgi:hypothetical protein
LKKDLKKNSRDESRGLSEKRFLFEKDFLVIWMFLFVYIFIEKKDIKGNEVYSDGKQYSRHPK